MTTLLMRLSGPMQAWGTQSRFRDRDTGPEPSKSGVIGLMCAALGRGRDEPLDDLAALRMGVRADRPGVLKVDFQTVGAGYPRYNKAGRIIGRANAEVIGPRYYLSDAVFLVGLEGDDALLRRVDRALAAPRWQLFLGRKAFLPGEPVRLIDGLRDQGLEEALAEYPRLAVSEGPLRLVLDDPAGSQVRTDLPLSFADRRFASRAVRTDWIEVAS